MVKFGAHMMLKIMKIKSKYDLIYEQTDSYGEKGKTKFIIIIYAPLTRCVKIAIFF